MTKSPKSLAATTSTESSALPKTPPKADDKDRSFLSPSFQEEVVFIFDDPYESMPRSQFSPPPLEIKIKFDDLLDASGSQLIKKWQYQVFRNRFLNAFRYYCGVLTISAENFGIMRDIVNQYTRQCISFSFSTDPYESTTFNANADESFSTRLKEKMDNSSDHPVKVYFWFRETLIEFYGRLHHDLSR
jgi:hypothetical protein